MRLHKITIGLPVYNAMPYLPHAIESLLGQSFGDFEVLAIVDGATDDSVEYLRSVRDERLRVLEQPNAGVAATLNRILAETRTAWLIRQDADDASLPHRLARMMQEIAAHPDAGMIYSLAEYQGGSVGRFRTTRGTSESRRKLVEQGYLLSICHSTVALNVAKTRALGGYRTGLHAEDADLWWRLALTHETGFIDEILVTFRQNAASISSRNFGLQELHGIYVQYLLLSHLYSYRPSSLEEVSPFLSALLSSTSLEAKADLRAFNMCLCERNLGQAAICLLRCALTSPRWLARRVADEFLPGRMIANGLPTQLFLERKDQLWPLQFPASAQLQQLQRPSVRRAAFLPESRSTG